MAVSNISNLVARRMPPLPTTKDLLRLYKIRAKKSLSQNFILDPRILKKFVKTAGNIEGHYAVEVGPGPGGITRAIFDAKVKECHVIEKDPRFIPTLNLIKNSLGDDNLQVSIGDCLHFNISKRLEGRVTPAEWESPLKPNLVLFGNLPFNVATPFIIKLLKEMSERTNYYAFGRMPAVLTFQHEVALRLVAPPDHPERCRLSIMAQNYADVLYSFNLPGGAFVPPPQVEVGVVKITPLRQPFIQLPYPLIDFVVNTLFLNGKNKYIRTTLKRLFVHSGVTPEESKVLVHELLENCDLNPKTSAIRLSLDDIKTLCFGYQRMNETHELLIEKSVEKTRESEEVFDEAAYFNDGEEIFVEKNSDKDSKFVVRFD